MIETEIAQLEAISGGDPNAFADWVAAAEPRIRMSLASFARVVDTESVVQETLLRIWQVAPKFEHDGGPDALVRLAVRTARNLAIDETRRRRIDRLTQEMLNELERPVPPPLEPDHELRRAIQVCRDKLPDRPRSALEARLLHPAARDEIAAASINMRLNTFFQNIRRARTALLKCLHRKGISLELKS